MPFFSLNHAGDVLAVFLHLPCLLTITMTCCRCINWFICWRKALTSGCFSNWQKVKIFRLTPSRGMSTIADDNDSRLSLRYLNVWWVDCNQLQSLLAAILFQTSNGALLVLQQKEKNWPRNSRKTLLLVADPFISLWRLCKNYFSWHQHAASCVPFTPITMVEITFETFPACP